MNDDVAGKEIERRFREYQEAPGFRPAPRDVAGIGILCQALPRPTSYIAERLLAAAASPASAARPHRGLGGYISPCHQTHFEPSSGQAEYCSPRLAVALHCRVKGSKCVA